MRETNINDVYRRAIISSNRGAVRVKGDAVSGGRMTGRDQDCPSEPGPSRVMRRTGK